MVKVHAEPLVCSYNVNRFSCASFCMLIYWAVILIVPYVVAYATDGMWIKEVSAMEQPSVRFTHEALVEAYASSASMPLISMGWSTSSELNAALGSKFRPSELRAWTQDDNRDGRIEALQIVLRVPLASGERMHSVSLMVGVNASYSSATKLLLNGSVFVQHSSPLPGLQSQQETYARIEGPPDTRNGPCMAPFTVPDIPPQQSYRRPIPLCLVCLVLLCCRHCLSGVEAHISCVYSDDATRITSSV